MIERSAGDPFFLEELLRGESQSESGRVQRLPETIHEMLLARLDALPAPARQTLQLGAVVGMEFSEQLVAALTADSGGDGGVDTDDAIRTLQRAELIVARAGEAGERMLAFRHPLIHEVAYRSLLLSTRRSLHGRIGRWLEDHARDPMAEPDLAPVPPPGIRDAAGMPAGLAGSASAPVLYHHVAALARHYRDSDDLGKARQYLPLAGLRAESLNAGWEAKGWYLDAADAFADEPARRAEMLEAAARQTYLVGVTEDAIGILEEAIGLYESAGEEVAALDARRWLGRYIWLQGDPVEADRQLELAITGLERLAPTQALAWAYSSRSQSLMLVPDYDAGVAWARRAIAVAEATGATGALAHAYNNLGVCLFHLGDKEGHDYLRKSLAMALKHGLADDAGRAYANLSGQGNRVFPGTYAEGQQFFDEAMAYAGRTIPGGLFDQWIRSGFAEFLIASARWAEAERALDEVDWSRAARYNRGEIAALRSQVASYRGQFEEGEALVTAAAEAAVQIGDIQAVFPTFIALAHAQAGAGNEAQAAATIRHAIDLCGQKKEGILSCWFVFEAADALTRAMRRTAPATDRAAIASGVGALSTFAAALAPRAGIAGEASVARVCRALFGSSVEQIASLRRALGLPAPSLDVSDVPGRAEAIDVLDRQHRPFDAARVRLWLAEERAGDASQLAGARRTFEELGAHPYLARAAALDVEGERPR